MPPRTERNPYTRAELKRVTANYLLGRESRRQDPLDSKKRKAAKAFVKEVAEIRDRPLKNGEDRYTYYELSKDIMVPNKKTGELEPLNQRTLRAYLGRHGEEENPPSQDKHKYKGVTIRPSYRTDEHFGCKHWIDPEGNDVPEGDPRADKLVFCERTEGPGGNTYTIHRGAQGGKRSYIEKVCRRHRLLEAKAKPADGAAA